MMLMIQARPGTKQRVLVACCMWSIIFAHSLHPPPTKAFGLRACPSLPSLFFAGELVSKLRVSKDLNCIHPPLLVLIRFCGKLKAS